MKQQDFTNIVTVDQSPEQVFNAINNPRAWWSENISGSTDRLGETFHYAYRNVHTCDILVEELVPSSRVVWHVVENHFEFTTDDREWKDTRIVFDIARQGEKTVLTFTHVGLLPEYECFDICQKAWTFFTGDSLYKLITTGTGDPVEIAEASETPVPESAKTGMSLSFLVDQSPSEVFDAVANVRGWWSEALVGESAELGDEFEFSYEDIHYSKHRLIDVIPNQRVVWETLDARLTFVEDQNEWIGTKIIFEIVPIGAQTELRFTHEGLNPGLQCYEGCSSGWSFFISKSLHELIAVGKGEPVALSAVA